MVPSSFAESNCVLSKPNDMVSCEVLTVLKTQIHLEGQNIPVVISCWKLTKEELEEINKTGRVWLTVVGDTMSPVQLTVEKPFQEKSNG